MEVNKKWNDYKVCLCGQFGVGKTTIFQKFAYAIDDPDLGQKRVSITLLSSRRI